MEKKFLERGRVARLLLPLAIMAALGAAPALAEDEPVDGSGYEEPGASDGSSGSGEPADPVWEDGDVAEGEVVWMEITDDGTGGDGATDGIPVEDGEIVIDDGAACDGCEVWTTGVEPDENMADRELGNEPVGRVSEHRSSQIRQWCLDGIFGQYSTRCAWVFR